MATLFEELIEDILSRLPVKSLLRFKIISKKWCYLISKNNKFHLKQLSFSSKNLILYQLITVGGVIFQYSNIDNYASRRIEFPLEIAKPCKLIGSANGLICIASSYEGDCCFIWNPCIGECKKISIPFRAAGCGLFGFGYDSISDDYKIVGDWDSHLRIFSLKTNSWKILEYSFEYALVVTALHSNGALHWCVFPHIAAFDLAKEKIVFLDLPELKQFVDDGYHSSCVPLFDYQGSLCVSGKKCIWVMKEYGNSKSWAKLSASLPRDYAKPVSISRLGEVVFHTDDGFVKSDIQGRMSDDDISQIMYYGDTVVFKESLISPEYFHP